MDSDDIILWRRMWPQITALPSGDAEGLLQFVHEHSECLAPGFLQQVFEQARKDPRAVPLIAAIRAMGQLIIAMAERSPSTVEPLTAARVRRGLAELLAAPPTSQAGAELLERAQAWLDQDLREVVVAMAQDAQRAGVRNRAQQFLRLVRLLDEVLAMQVHIDQATTTPADIDIEHFGRFELWQLLQRLCAVPASPEASEDLQRAEKMVIAARRIGDEKLLGGCLFHLGVIVLRLGDGAQATAAYEEALAICADAPFDEKLRILGNLALAYELTGDLVQACQTLERILAEAADDAKTGVTRANALLNYGRLQRQRGDHDAARGHYLAALASIHGPADVAVAAHHGLANLHRDRNELAHTLAHAAEVLDRCSKDSRIAVQVRSLVSSCFSRLGLMDDAKALLDECLQSATAQRDPHLSGLLNGNLAVIELHQGDLERAQTLARKSMAEVATRQDRRGLIVPNMVLHAISARRGDEATARSLLTTAIDLADELQEHARILSLLRAAAQDPSWGTEELSASRRALESLRMLRQFARTSATRATFWDDAQAVLLSHVRRCLRGRSDELRWEAACCLDEANSWMHLDELGQTSRLPELGPRTVQQLLGVGDWVLVIGGEGREHTAFLIGRNQLLGPFTLPLEDLAPKVEQLATDLVDIATQGVTRRAAERIDQTLGELGDVLGETELWRALGQLQLDRLVVAGSALWQFLPLHALPLVKNGPPLIELCGEGISWVPAVGVYELCARRIQSSTQQDMSWTVFANPELGKPELDLPGTEPEAMAFGSRVQVWTRRAASANRFLAALQSSPRVAFLGHGTTDPWDAMAGALLLSDEAGGMAELSARYILEHFATLEIKAQVVFLSACHLGASSVRFDLPMSGHPRVLLNRGCGAVVAHAWPISDRLAPIFTGAALASLEVHPSLGRAVRAGVAALRQQSPHAFHWAGCRLFGAL